MDIQAYREAAQTRARRARFDPCRLELPLLARPFAPLAANPPPFVLGLLRRFCPTLRLPLAWGYTAGGWWFPKLQPWLILTRADDVRAMLDSDDYVVWWGRDLAVLNAGAPPGTPFMLGCDVNGPPGLGRAAYELSRAEVMAAFRTDDAATVVARAAGDAASARVRMAIEETEGTLDAIQDVFLPAGLAIIEHYLGVAVPPDVTPFDFLCWTIAASGFLFGPPFEADRTRAIASAGVDRLALLVDEAIAAAVQAHRDGRPAKGVVDNLVPPSPHLSQCETTRAILLGMIVGALPTVVMAAGHLLQVLLDRPQAQAAARQAAVADDDVGLSRCLWEAMRFHPLNPGPWRQCARDVTIARGTSREKVLRRGTHVLASTHAAMWDPQRVAHAAKFDPQRDPAQWLHLGHGLHYCVGRFIAEAQLVQSFKPLLRTSRLLRAPGRLGTPTSIGLFPRQQFLDLGTQA